MTEPIHYNIAEACEQVKISECEMRGLIKRGDLIARKYGRRYLIEPAELRAWSESLPYHQRTA